MTIFTALAKFVSPNISAIHGLDKIFIQQKFSHNIAQSLCMDDQPSKRHLKHAVVSLIIIRKNDI